MLIHPGAGVKTAPHAKGVTLFRGLSRWGLAPSSLRSRRREAISVSENINLNFSIRNMDSMNIAQGFEQAIIYVI